MPVATMGALTSLPTIEGEKMEEEMAEQHTFSVVISFTGFF